MTRSAEVGVQPSPPQVSDRTLRLMAATRPWVKLLSVLMFITVALMVLAGLVMMVGMSFLPMPENELPGPLGAITGIMLGAVYIAGSLLYLFPALYLSRYAKAIAALGAAPTVAALEAALTQQKSFWKFVGIMAVVGLALFILAMVAAVTIPLLLMVIGRGPQSATF